MQELYDKVATWLSNFFNHPAVIWITNITLIFVYALVVFSKTSLGRKLFNKALAKYDTVVGISKQLKEESDKFKQEAKEQVESLQKEYDEKLNVAVSYAEQLENLLYQIGDVIPNAKVKECINEFKSQKETRTQEISKVVGTYEQFKELTLKGAEIEQEIETRVKEQVDKFQELYENKAKELDALIARYKTFEYNEQELLEETHYEEEDDTNPEEETL